MAPYKMETRENISRAIQQAMVEILTLKAAGLPMNISVNFEQTAERDYIRDVSFRQAEDGSITPVFLQEQLRQIVLGSLVADAGSDEGDDGGYTEPGQDDSQEFILDNGLGSDQENKDGSAVSHMGTQAQSKPLATSEIVQGPEEIEETFLDVTANHESWMHVQFEDTSIKFAVG